VPSDEEAILFTDVGIIERHEESYLVQVADYAKVNCIDDKPVFAWWVPDVFLKRESKY
jgi:hypothetical protein